MTDGTSRLPLVPIAPLLRVVPILGPVYTLELIILCVDSRGA